MRKLICVILTQISVALVAFTQDSLSKPKIHNDKFSFGLGIGLDQGGIGGSLLYYPQRNIGIFAGLGYAIIGPGFNGGLKIRIVNKSYSQRVAPYFLSMYGYNTVIRIQNAEIHNKMFFGFTGGFGLDMYPKNARKGYWSIALIVPVRDSKVKDYITHLEDFHQVKMTRELIPVGFTIAYRKIIK